MVKRAVIQLRRDDAAAWEAEDPLLGLGEMGLVLDEQALVMGRGDLPFSALNRHRCIGGFLPTSDPGGNLPWINGGVLSLGPPGQQPQPLAHPDAYVVEENKTLDVPSPGVLANDLFCTAVDSYLGPSNGTGYVGGAGRVVYTPNADFVGTDSFTYTARNGAGDLAAPVTVTITVVEDTASPDPTPVGAADAYQTDKNTVLNVSAPGVIINDFNTVEASPDTQPSNGSVVVNSDGSFTYTPNNDFVGQDSFTYLPTDPALVSPNGDPTTVTIDVIDVDGELPPPVTPPNPVAGTPVRLLRRHPNNYGPTHPALKTPWNYRYIGVIRAGNVFLPTDGGYQ